MNDSIENRVERGPATAGDARFAELHGIVDDLHRIDKLLREGFHIGCDGKRRDGWFVEMVAVLLNSEGRRFHGELRTIRRCLGETETIAGRKYDGRAFLNALHLGAANPFTPISGGTGDPHTPALVALTWILSTREMARRLHLNPPAAHSGPLTP